jgi:hypothetical protein
MSVYLIHHPHRELPGTADVIFHTHRGSGPGGQKRNKTSSAVRATHTPTGTTATSDDTRSQGQNKEAALARLRHLLTVRFRKRVFLDRLQVPEGLDLGGSMRGEGYLQVLGHVLDVLHAAEYSLSRAATHLDTTTGQLSRFLTRDAVALDQVNVMRKSLHLRPLERR